MRGVNDTMVTINAAASAIQSAENRATQSSSVQKRRWRSCLNISRCFGSQKQSKRISHAVLDPNPNSSTTEPPTTTTISHSHHAPPSSPASFFQSEPPSAAHSPGGFLPFTSVSAAMYSPSSGPTNIFDIGPYAYETQLVSPPVFSTYTTEPSTAPFTPPPESVYLTTPSSPEVPYARLLVPYEFQSYKLFPDGDFSRGGAHCEPCCQWDSRTGSGVLTPDPEDQQHLVVVDHRISFEVTSEQVVRCVEKRRYADVARQHNGSTTTLGSVKEFNFDSTDGSEYDWWTGEKVLGKENGSIKNWSFFPMMQPGVS